MVSHLQTGASGGRCRSMTFKVCKKYTIFFLILRLQFTFPSLSNQNASKRILFAKIIGSSTYKMCGQQQVNTLPTAYLVFAIKRRIFWSSTFKSFTRFLIHFIITILPKQHKWIFRLFTWWPKRIYVREVQAKWFEHLIHIMIMPVYNLGNKYNNIRRRGLVNLRYMQFTNTCSTSPTVRKP